jgi:hypothetical protein
MTSRSSEFREYENGIADVLASVVGEAGTVSRNVKLPSRSGGTRQIDVLVEGNIAGVANARMVVDGKRWKTRIDKADVDRFIGLLDDIGADMGILVSAAGASRGAMERAKAARGVRIKAVSVDELKAWRPRGTVVRTMEIPQSSLEKALQALRERGLRVMVMETNNTQVKIEVFRHYGTITPDGETLQAPQHKLTEATLDKLKVPYKVLAQGVIAGGGTPNHRWLNVHILGSPVILKVLAATEDELAQQLTAMAGNLGIPVEALTVEKPDGWPFASAFPF